MTDNQVPVKADAEGVVQHFPSSSEASRSVAMSEARSLAQRLTALLGVKFTWRWTGDGYSVLRIRESKEG